ncbi:fumarate reductase/succinate dehydrogenase flavoprotein domain protein [Thermotoga petrophila RKU-1]|jgi:succinate dehydrogenase/fumarate reductase flavoprotein subunit|uniref:Fumarate reductase/succinate dehydrogenase flavoprotein domain protein n=1 Tax=Thermotoga petrophila (strain ATCC BAA-488 / DSM 13995 / JCM 10881 / RKU-1) TaxID=390874 RepID=A5IJZ3_THEP1|nr:FAD-binding protein [Thermotoga petrophila]ABQ46516.1 fumarate reductase/succinate dehydrogenase flavoprotein domain protein [Thermotoga petrophila RKU-1]MBZ4661345.1 fumarate reductase/succinate dehydrogenase flavoprotein domain protein [Thermotoga sp.]
MRESVVKLNEHTLRIFSLNTIVVGSGAAGLNAVDRVFSFGQKDVALLTDNLKWGTSRNTGSDKQTYYKLTLAGNVPDSVYELAETLFNGGSMDGDIALVEAALSARAFFRLVELGVPFPHSRYGEYVGYKTDHDPKQRATSAGPLTSYYMCEKLLEEIRRKGIKIFEGYQAIGILTDRNEEKTIGLIALDLNNLYDPEKRYVLFNVKNIIYATGGPAGMFYFHSVYPPVHFGATGIAFEAGVMGKNLTEWQFGIASKKFRWNLSGTYQQVIPRYVSTDENGNDEREFLEEYFPDPSTMLNAIFLKGYQWPFDVRKIKNYGSSLIDILVFYETVIKGRRVWLDFTRNPSWGSKNGELDFSLLGKEAYEYLKNSGALFGRPIDRLEKMNGPAIEVYLQHGIDLRKEYLEIGVCAQHNNGGLHGNIWWESNLKHFFPVGEVNGSHGVYRPGGSALNSGQVGGVRAAQYIVENYSGDPLCEEEILEEAKDQILKKIELGESFVKRITGKSNVSSILKEISERSMRSMGIVRSLEEARKGKNETLRDFNNLIEKVELSSIRQLPFAFRLYDVLLTQYVYLSAVENYIESGGKSRGSYIVHDPTGELPIPNLPEMFRYSLAGESFNKKIQRVRCKENRCEFFWDPVKEIPREDTWFETVWNSFMRREVLR